MCTTARGRGQNSIQTAIRGTCSAKDTELVAYLLHTQINSHVFRNEAILLWLCAQHLG